MTRTALFVLASLAVGCFRSHVPQAVDAGPEPIDAACDGAALPAEIVGGFQVVATGCRVFGSDDGPFPQLGLIGIGACGNAWTGVPDGHMTTGTVRAVGDGYVYQSDELTFRLRAGVDSRLGTPILELDDSPWEAWAIRAPNIGATVTVPHLYACGVHETWSMYDLTNAAAGRLLTQGETTIERSDSGPSVQMGNPGSSLSVTDPRLPLATGAVGYLGGVVRWDGATGRAERYSVLDACHALDGEVEIEWDGATLATQADWLVLDVDDVDGDGDSSDLVVRRSHMESRPDACP